MKVRFLVVMLSLLFYGVSYAEVAKEVSADRGEITVSPQGGDAKVYPADKFKVVEKDSKCTVVNKVKRRKPCPKPVVCPVTKDCPHVDCPKCPDPVVQQPEEKRKNRVFLMVGYGPTSLGNDTKDDTVIVSKKNDAVVGVGYSRYLFDNVDAGVGVMSNKTAFGSLGFNF